MRLKKTLIIVTAIVVGTGLALLLAASAAARPESEFLLLLWSTKDSVRVGEELDFEGIVVNSSVTTLENVLILNSIPAHTRFVTVAGDGFFPIFASNSQYNDCYSYYGNNITAGDVVGVGWTGDVEPGTQGMITFCLTLDVVSADPADLVITDTVLVYHEGELATTATSSVMVEVCTYTLDVLVVGNGTVVQTPRAPYQDGVSVTLDAVPSACWVFDHWSGEPLDGNADDPTVITMNDNYTVTAHFVETLYHLYLPLMMRNYPYTPPPAPT